MIRITYRDNRFFCGECNTPVTRPRQYCSACRAEFAQFTTARRVVGTRRWFERLWFMSGEPQGTDNALTIITPDLACAGCGTRLNRPSPECPTCCRRFPRYAEVMAAAPDAPPQTQLKAMAGTITLSDIPAAAAADETTSKLVTGITRAQLDTLADLADTQGISGNEWIRRQIARGIRPDVTAMAQALGITPDRFITLAVDRALTGGLMVPGGGTQCG